MSKKFILTVQGEGRGHITQALTTYDMLIDEGHQVCAVILGSGGTRDVPTFFYERVKAPIIRLQSPNFVSDKKNKSINVTKSVLYNLSQLKVFMQSLKTMHRVVQEHQPDVILNFFDLLTGLYYRFYRPKIKLVCIAHQYIYFHRDFEFPEGRWLDRLAIRFYTRLTAHGSSKNLALSFYKIHTSDEEVVVVPPLLRKEVFNLPSSRENFYLVYLVNNGYFEDLIEWHLLNPEVELHCFTDQADQISKNYTFNRKKLVLHAINDTLFLEMMSRASGLASTAGFESVCEAMYLGKPVLMVPIQGHYEQYCNSRDACKAGAGVFADRFDLSKLANISATFDGTNTWFKNWVANAKHRIYHEIITV